jgi:Holliday junction resolvase RusA-like endonuclease
METIKIAALSVNRSYQGRRFATPELKAYKQAVSWLLPPMKVPLDKKLSVKYEFGVSSKNADGDNLIKAFQDILCERYEFNDRQIYRWEVEKVDVKKGQEYIKFEIAPKK